LRFTYYYLLQVQSEMIICEILVYNNWNLLGISESIKIHEEKIELKYGINSTELANVHINPKYRTVRY